MSEQRFLLASPPRDRGEILRTHVLRPTWHFVTPADIRWLLKLSAPRVHAASAAPCTSAASLASAIARFIGAMPQLVQAINLSRATNCWRS